MWKVKRWFLSHSEDSEEARLHSANMQECLKLILEWNGDVSCQDDQGMTPLHWALQAPSKSHPFLHIDDWSRHSQRHLQFWKVRNIWALSLKFYVATNDAVHSLHEKIIHSLKKVSMF